MSRSGIILAAATYHVKLSGGSQLAVGYTSIIIALITFIGILVYHIFQRVKLWMKIPKLNRELKENQVVTQPDDNSVLHENPPKTVTVISADDFTELREPLLEDPPKPNYGAF